MKAIRSDHLYHTLRHPTVIGHMGNILEFQENTLEGIQSLIQIKADGVHMHVQLTEDDQLILFQDQTLYVYIKDIILMKICSFIFISNAKSLGFQFSQKKNYQATCFNFKK